jgi:CheY-like chemotaxis protein
MTLRPRILLADDDDSVRLGVADLLDSQGLEVRQAGTGLEAVELVRVQRFDAAVLDWHMPGLTGLEALRELRSQHAGTPCIVYSGDLTQGMADLAREAGALSVLRKPVRPHLLRAEVLRALELSSWNPGDPGFFSSFHGAEPADGPRPELN